MKLEDGDSGRVSLPPRGLSNHMSKRSNELKGMSGIEETGSGM